MFKPLSRLVAAAASIVIAAPALADQSADVSLANFTITLVDLDPGDGISPSLTFAAASTPYDEGDVYAMRPGAIDGDQQLGYAAYSPISVQAFLPGVGTAGASVAGDILQGGLQLHASAATTLPTDSAASGQVRLIGSPLQGFTLSAHTLMLMSGTASLQATSDEANPFAQAWLTLEVDAADGDPALQDTWSRFVTAGHALEDTARLSFSNAGGDPMQGYLTGVATALTQSSSPVPAPAGAALMLAGLGCLGLSGRGRRRGRQPGRA